jgi:hypothetical protein
VKLQTAIFLGGALAIAVSGPPQARVSEQEAARLGGGLTPVGALWDGNDAGTIPAWEPWPAQGDAGGENLTAENFPDTIGKLLAEEPKFVITADNYRQYADRLTEGHKALFELYPDYRMQVYPTHRNMGYPDRIEKYTKRNATSAHLDGCNDCLRDAELGFPFPIPQSGAEAIWNHRLRWRGEHVRRNNDQAIVRPDGTVQITKLIENVKFPYTLLDDRERTRIEGEDDVMIYYQAETVAPPRTAGRFLLAWEHVGHRSGWIYNPGLRRVRRIPNAGYDNSYEGTDGQQFYDQVDMYNGALDRYRYELVGKREILILYNNFAVNDPDLSYRDDLLGEQHFNQALMRYELHRVWVVEATLREGFNHLFKRRTFYLDEDGWNIVAVDCYDNRDQLWKFQEAAVVQYPPLRVTGGAPELIYDLQSGAYFATAMSNEGEPNDYSVTYEDRYFSPQSLRRRATR